MIGQRRRELWKTENLHWFLRRLQPWSKTNEIRSADSSSIFFYLLFLHWHSPVSGVIFLREAGLLQVMVVMESLAWCSRLGRLAPSLLLSLLSGLV